MSPSPVRILFVDDEERILRSLAMQFRRHYEVLTESDPWRALERLKTERIQVLVSDQRMPQMSGAELLAQARERYPETLRILLTGYSDLDAAVDALNDGGIFRYLTKPWNPQEMAFTLRQAAEIASVLLLGLTLGVSSFCASVYAVRAAARAEPLYTTSPTLA